MKTLTLLRHAKSGWDEAVARDFDRPLNAKGKRAARTVGRHLREQGMEFDRVVASPAVRVTETLEELFEGYGRRMTPLWEKRIYLAAEPTLLELVRETPDATERLLIAGHNPGLEELALALVAEGTEGPRGEIEEKLPTGSVIEIAFDVDHWGQVDEGAGRLVRFVRPRDLDPELGPDAD